MGFFYVPWMILTGYEISGNICVTVAFLASPGFSNYYYNQVADSDSDLVTGVELQLVLPFYLASRVFQGLERSVLRCKNAMFLLEWREEQL